MVKINQQVMSLTRSTKRYQIINLMKNSAIWNKHILAITILYFSLLSLELIILHIRPSFRNLISKLIDLLSSVNSISQLFDWTVILKPQCLERYYFSQILDLILNMWVDLILINHSKNILPRSARQISKYLETKLGH